VVLTKDELVEKLQHEVRILLHLVSKVDPAKLDLSSLVRNVPLFTPLEVSLFFCFAVVIRASASASP